MECFPPHLKLQPIGCLGGEVSLRIGEFPATFRHPKRSYAAFILFFVNKEKYQKKNFLSQSIRFALVSGCPPKKILHEKGVSLSMKSSF
jgi:hypothetical protein